MTKKYKSLQQLFRKESRWTQCAYARDKEGNEVPIRSKRAVCFCLSAGVELVYSPNKGHEVREHLIDVIARRRLQYSGTTWYNDRTDTTIEDIRSLVKEAKV